MSGTYADPITYKLRTIFTMPDAISGGRRAISFSSSDSSQILAGYSIIITFIFMSIWDIVAAGAMMWPLSSKKNPAKRCTTLVGLWNSNDAWTAFALLVDRLKIEFGIYNFVMFILSGVIAGGGLAAGILGPERLIIGHVAPVSEFPQILFYPNLRDDATGSVVSTNGFSGLPILRALGTAGGLPASLKDRVKRTYTEITQTDEQTSVPGARLTYSYQLSGVDFGLQTASRLVYNVDGVCETNYEWLLPRDSPDGDTDMDTYLLWDGQPVTITKIRPNIDKTPPALFFLDFDRYEKEYAETGVASFAIILGSAHRFSTTVQPSDPWYLSEPIPQDFDGPPEGAIHWVKDRRPALVCEQKNVWSYNGHNATSAKLTELPGLNLAPVLGRVLQDALLVPKIYEIGLFQGSMAMLSATTFVNGVLSAGKSYIESDFSLLVRASYIMTRDIFKDTTLVTERFDLQNMFQNADGGSEPGSGDFVIATIDVDTYSVTWLIIIPALLAGLWIIRLFFWKLRKSTNVAGEWWWAYYLQRCKAYDATAMYRSIAWLCMHIERPGAHTGNLEDYCPALVLDALGRSVYLQPNYGQHPMRKAQELGSVEIDPEAGSDSVAPVEKKMPTPREKQYEAELGG